MQTLVFLKHTVYLISVCMLLTSCQDSSTGCGDGGPWLADYRIEEYTMDFGVFQADQSLAGESASSYMPNAVIDPLDFALLLDGTIDWVSRAGKMDRGFRFSWFSAAYACSPARYEIPLQRLVKYEITSTGSFGADFPAGADIRSLFLEYSRTAPDAAVISRFVEEDITNDAIPPVHQTIRLSAIPLDAEHIFTVTIELDDGDYYQFVSPLITFILQE